MELSIYNTVGIVFNPFDNYNQKVGTVLESANVRNSAHFIYVAALRKARSYSRLEKIHSIFRGY